MPATWLVAALETFGRSVVSLVPGGFAGYVRVFHPAYRRTESGDLALVRWADIAVANKTRVHPAMQLIAVAGGQRFIHEGQAGVYDHAPLEGTLPPELIDPLVAILRRNTSTPDHCWFAVWNGFGAIRADVAASATFQLPGRKYHLFAGPIEAVAESIVDPLSTQSPNLWWPDDRAWCVATEVDLNTTYVGCDERCQGELLACLALEAAPVSPDDGISFKSDAVNRWPEPD